MKRLILIMLVSGRVFSAIPTESERISRLRGRYLSLENAMQTLGAKYQDLYRRLEDTEGRVVDIANTCEGRLTLQTGVPIPVSDQATVGTLYFAPFRGNNCAVWTGSTWVLKTFTQFSLNIATAGLTGNTNYDIFVYDNSGLQFDTAVAWTDNFTRTALTARDGVWVKTGAETRRYVGTIRTNAAGTATDDTVGKRHVWNFQNRVPRLLRLLEASDNWTYATIGWRSANNLTTNRVETVIGIADTLVEIRSMLQVRSSANDDTYYSQGVGMDTTTNVTSQIRGAGVDNSMDSQTWSDYRGYPPVGYHYFQWVENSTGNTITAWGDNGNNTRYQGGLLGEISG